MQTKSTIIKSVNLTATYWTTSYGVLMDNDGDISIAFGDDGYIGIKTIEAGLEFIKWDANKPYVTENISWVE